MVQTNSDRQTDRQKMHAHTLNCQCGNYVSHTHAHTHIHHTFIVTTMPRSPQAGLTKSFLSSSEFHQATPCSQVLHSNNSITTTELWTHRQGHCRYRGYLFFSVKDRNLFHRLDTIGNIFTCGCATRENITDVFTR